MCFHPTSVVFLLSKLYNDRKILDTSLLYDSVSQMLLISLCWLANIRYALFHTLIIFSSQNVQENVCTSVSTTANICDIRQSGLGAVSLFWSGLFLHHINTGLLSKHCFSFFTTCVTLLEIIAAGPFGGCSRITRHDEFLCFLNLKKTY